MDRKLMFRRFLPVWATIGGLVVYAALAWAATSAWNTGTGTGQCDSSYTLSTTNIANDTATSSASGSWRACLGTPTTHGRVSHGKYYFELKVSAYDSSNGWMIGVATSAKPVGSGNYLGSTINSIGMQPTSGSGTFYCNGGSTSSSTCSGSLTAGTTVVGFAADFDSTTSGVQGAYWCTLNGTTWNQGGSANPATGVGAVWPTGCTDLQTNNVFPAFSGNTVSGNADGAILRTQASQFSYTIPSGFSAWDTGAAASRAFSLTPLK